MKKTIRIVLITVAAALLLGVVALAASAATSAGSEDDPLVTLSYINDVFLPYVTELFHKDLEEKETALQEALEERVTALEGTVGGAGGKEYVVETLEAGQTLVCQRGAELMLRIGKAAVTAENIPGLVDTATTGNLNDGEELIVNHLYMVTINGHGVRALETVKILVRGEYTIS